MGAAARTCDGSLGILLADANILIDLVDADALCLIGELVRTGLAAVYVPRIIYDEVAEMITELQVAALGIVILPVERALVARAAAYPDKSLSAPDRTLIVTAQERGYSVWTNDRRLRQNCSAQGVATLWEFEALLPLVERDYFSADELLAIARRVEEANPFLTGIASRLGERLMKKGKQTTHK